MVPLPYRVAWRRAELADTVTLGLEPIGEAIEPPDGGQFDMLWEPGVGEVPISVSGFGTVGSPVLEHTIRAVGAVTTSLCGRAVGDLVGVRGPFGRGWELSAAEGDSLLLVAGGIGLAPLRPVVLDVLARRDRFQRVALLVGARDPATLLFADQLEGWRGRFDIDVEVTVDTATPAWHGDVGVVTKLVGRLPMRPEATVAFVCGPEVMMRAVAALLLDRAVPAERIFVSLERNMHCGVGHCGHCQLGPLFACTDGPVMPWTVAAPLVLVRER